MVDDKFFSTLFMDRSVRYRVLFDILRDAEVGEVETCSKFYTFQTWVRSTYALLSTWYRIGRCRFLLEFLNGTEFDTA